MIVYKLVYGKLGQIVICLSALYINNLMVLLSAINKTSNNYN